MALPYMSNQSMMRPVVQTQFGGLNNNLNAVDGEIVWMENMSSREYPLMRPRKPRGLWSTLTDPRAFSSFDDVAFWVDGDGFYYDGVRKGTVTQSIKQFAVMGSRVIIFPDKKYYDFKSGVFGDLGAAVSVICRVDDGQIYGAPAKANTLAAVGDLTGVFKVGDAITIQGQVTQGHPYVNPANNKTAILREMELGILQIGDYSDPLYVTATYLRFDENCFTLRDQRKWICPLTENLPAGSYYYIFDGQPYRFDTAAQLDAGGVLFFMTAGITYVRCQAADSSIVFSTMAEEGEGDTLLEFTSTGYPYFGSFGLKREVPDMDFICVNENRLWGCKGDTIYASALGDPTNFNVFDGLSTDSWASDATDAGDFTACVSYQGYPVFFKEDSVFKIQGDGANNFAWTRTARFGVQAGSERSLAVAGETLFYLSRVGVCAYQGGMPQVISMPLGANAKWSSGVGGSDGLRYYISMMDEEETVHLFVFDTRYGVWHREDNTEALAFTFMNYDLLMLAENGDILDTEGWTETQEEPVTWQVKFADSYRFYETTDSGSQNKKGPLRILIRAALAEGTTIEVKIKYDDGNAHLVGTLTGSSGEKKKTYIIPLILRRCDHYRLSLDGVGDAVIYSIAIEKYSGAQFQGSSVTLPNADSM